MEDILISFLLEHNYKYIKLSSEKELKKVYNLLINDHYEEPETEIEYLYYGIYYQLKGNKYMAINYYLLGEYFYEAGLLTNDYGHYLKSADQGNTRAMNILGQIYEREHFLPEAIKYYSMAVHLGDITKLNYLIDLLPIDDPRRIHLYALGEGLFDFNDKIIDTINCLMGYNEYFPYRDPLYPKIIKKLTEDIDVSIFETLSEAKNYLLNNDKLSNETLELICTLKIKNVPEYLNQIRVLYQETIRFLELHFKYKPNGAGMRHAQASFEMNKID